MAAPQAIASFDGIPQEAIIGCEVYFNAHGISHSVFRLDLVPLQNLSQLNGTLTISYGTNPPLSFPDCRIDLNQLVRDTRGQVITVYLFDRRWKWKFDSISGEYNRRTDDAQRLALFGKSPQNLAELCFQAMKETTYDVSELPNEARPYINWDLDNPARALADLCDLFQCRVVLGLDNIPRIKRVGIGQALPIDDTVLSRRSGYDSPELPDRIVVKTAPQKYQLDLLLEAVAKELDGSIKPADPANPECVSYAEKAMEDLDHFMSVYEDKGKKAAEYARESFGKWFRVRVPFTCSLLGEVTDRERIILLDEQCEHEWHELDKRYVPADPLVYGRWTNTPLEGEPRQDTDPHKVRYLSNVVTTATTDTSMLPIFNVPAEDEDNDPDTNSPIVPHAFTIDSNLGLVKFSQQIIDFDENAGLFGDVVFPALILRCACYIRDTENQKPLRFEQPKRLTNTPALESRDAVLIREDIQPLYIEDYPQNSEANAQYGSELPLVGGGILFQNNASLINQATFYLEQAERALQTNDSEIITYAGVKLVEPDGAITQLKISWDTNQAPTTTISYNDENLEETSSYAQRRQQEKLAQIFARERALGSAVSPVNRGNVA